MFGCFKTLSVRISLLIYKITKSRVGKSLKIHRYSRREIKIENGNLKRDVNTSDTRLIDDFDGEWFAGNSIYSEFNLCGISLSKCPPKLVFTNTHSLYHHPIQIPDNIENQKQYRLIKGETKLISLWLCFYIYKEWRLDMERGTRHYPFASSFSLLLYLLCSRLIFFSSFWITKFP